MRNLNEMKILFLFILTNIVYTIMLAITIPRVMSYSNGMKIPDMLPTGYSPEYVNTLMQTLGTEGRNAYLYQQIPLDMIYPGLFGITYCLLLAYILKKLEKHNSKLFALSIIPFASGIFDYLENIGVITMLTTFPNTSATIIRATSIFSILKSTLTMVYFAILIISLFVLLTRYIRSKRKSSANV